MLKKILQALLVIFIFSPLYGEDITQRDNFTFTPFLGIHYNMYKTDPLLGSRGREYKMFDNTWNGQLGLDVYYNNPYVDFGLGTSAISTTMKHNIDIDTGGIAKDLETVNYGVVSFYLAAKKDFNISNHLFYINGKLGIITDYSMKINAKSKHFMTQAPVSVPHKIKVDGGYYTSLGFGYVINNWDIAIYYDISKFNLDVEVDTTEIGYPGSGLHVVKGDSIAHTTGIRVGYRL